MTGKRRKARIIALQSLYAYQYNPDLELDDDFFFWLKDYDKIPEVLDFSRIIIQGTLDHLGEIDQSIKQHLHNWDIQRISRVCLALLRISVYSLFYQKEISASVTINEAVEIAKIFEENDSFKFVNGVLDGIRNSVEKSHESP